MNLDINGLDKLQDNLKQLAQTGVDELNKGLERINNPDAAKSQVPDACTCCGASLPKNKEAAVIKCEYCGTEFDNSSVRSIADSVFDFVERQQEISAKERNKHLELKLKKAELKAARRKKAGFIRFILLILVVFAILYYYFVIMGGTI